MGFFGKKNYNGITKKTVEHIQLDAGAFFKNFEVGKDDYASAKAAGSLSRKRRFDKLRSTARARGSEDLPTWTAGRSR